MKFVKEASYEIFDDYYMNGALIKNACETTWQSQNKTKKTSDDFIKMIIKNNHTAMLEFSWFVVEIPLMKDNLQYSSEMMNYYNSKKYLNCSVGQQGLIVSGNGRAWYEIFKEEPSRYENANICWEFKKINSALFNFPAMGLIKINILTKEEVQQKDNNFDSIAKIQDEKSRMKHDWLAVKFSNISRGFTHEIVRHRTMSFAQLSTRYVLMKDFNFIIDDMITKNSVDFKKIEDSLTSLQETYNYLINRGYKKDEVRQLLPVGIGTEIFVAGNLESWKHLFDLRIAKDAHWEIRIVMNDLKDELVEKGYNF
jgi:flavin-dependent thymidylate synthase